jgi:hypothetical protein
MPISKFHVAQVVNTTEFGEAIIRQIYSDGDFAVSFPEYSPSKLFTVSPWEVSRKRGRPPNNKGPLAKKRKSASVMTRKSIRTVTKKKYIPIPTVKQKRNTYTKSETASKTQQNTEFITYLRSLNRPMNKLRVIVLDTSKLRTTRLLLAAGLTPAHIYIPQPDPNEAAMMIEYYPTLSVFPGIKAGDLIWKMAGTNTRFDGVMMDYCGMPGTIGRKNMPIDDMANMFRYNILADDAVLTQTVCARSCVKVLKKYEGFKNLIKSIRNHSRRDGRRLSKAKQLIYTDPGCQTMCHFKCILHLER